VRTDVAAKDCTVVKDAEMVWFSRNVCRVASLVRTFDMRCHCEVRIVMCLTVQEQIEMTIISYCLLFAFMFVKQFSTRCRLKVTENFNVSLMCI